MKVEINNPQFSELNVRFLPNIDMMILLSDFKYRSDSRHQIIVPKDFISDGASIPRFLWPVYGHPLYHKNRRAAVIHDYLYYCGEKVEGDKIFYEILLLEGRKATAKQMYLAVKWFGGRKII